MPAINFPSGFFLSKTSGQPIALGKLFVGITDTDPTVEGNRINVTVIQENGTPVVVAPNQQPFVLNAAGMLVYGGSVVQMRTGGNCSIAVYSSTDVLQYYFPSASSNEDVTASLIQLIAQGSAPTPVAGSGWIYSMVASGITELFYMDSLGNEIQLTENGAIKVNLPDSVVDVLGVASDYYLGKSLALEIEDGVLAIDWKAGQYFRYTNTENHTITFSNVPLIGGGYGQTIMLAIEDAGNFSIALDPGTGYAVYRRSTDNLGSLTVDGLDILVCTVYATGIVMVVPLLEFVSN